MRLNYKRGKLAGVGLLAVGLGVGGLLLALSPFEGGRGSTRLIVAILGPGGTQIFVPLGKTRHMEAHMPGGYRYNPGGAGGSG